MSTLRIGWIGAGLMGQHHLTTFHHLDGCEIVALAELREDLRTAVADRFGIRHRYADHRDLLASASVDALVSIQHYGLHGALLPQLAQAHVPILTEKALARTSAIGQRIVDACRERHAPLYVGYHKRSDPAIAHAVELIADWRRSGAYGAMRLVRLGMPPGDWSPGGMVGILTSRIGPSGAFDPLPAHFDEEMGQRLETLTAYYSHQINLLRYLLGEDYTVDHLSANRTLLAATSTSGICGTIEMSAYRTTVDWQEQAFIAFDQGWIRVELPAPRVAWRSGRITIFRDAGRGEPPTETTVSLPSLHAMRQQAMHFLAAVRGDAHPLCGGAEAVGDLAVCEHILALGTPRAQAVAAGVR